MPNPTIFDKIGSYSIGGVIPVWVIAILILIILIIWLVLTRMPRTKEYKAIDLKKEIKDDLDTQYKYFGSAVNKPLFNGMLQVGIVRGHMPLVWHNRRYSKIIEKKFKDGIKKIEVQINEKEAQQTKQKTIYIDVPIDLMALKIYQGGFLAKIKSMLGFGMKYFIYEKNDVNMDEESIIVSSGLQRQYFFGQFIFSKAGKYTIDNTSFRIDRENQLQEIANQIPRTVFFDTELAKRVVLSREAYALEKEKYKSQVESQQD